MAKRYRVVAGTSTRASADPASPDYETWVHWQPGDGVGSWPEHLPVDALVSSGAWAPDTAHRRRDAEQPEQDGEPE